MSRAASNAVRPEKPGSLNDAQESIMKKFTLAVGMVAMAATLALAGPGGYGMGMGQGCGAANATGAACCGPGGNGPGPGFGRGGFNGGGGPAMALLTPEEQAQHRAAMHSFKTTEECTAYMAQHQQLMQERAKEKGVAAPLGPRGNPCERMKMRGMTG
jgi:hypothetical protein